MRKFTYLLKTLLVSAALLIGGGSSAWAGEKTTLYHRATTTADGATVWSGTDYDGTSEGSWTGDVTAVTLSSNAIKIESNAENKSISKSLSYTGYPILTFDAVWNIGSKSGNNNAANRTYFMIGDQIRFQHYPRSATNWAKVTIGGNDIKQLDGSPVEASVDWTIHVVINTFTNTITEFTVSSSNSAFSMSLSDIPEAKRSLSSTSVYSTLTLGTEAGTKPVTSLKSIKVQSEKQVYQYTVNYKTNDESIVKTVSAYNYPGETIPVERIITGDDSKEYIVTDADLPSQTIADDTDDAEINIINLNVRKRYKCNLIVKNSFDDVIDEDFTVVTPLEESEDFVHNWKYVFPLYKKKGDNYYKATLKSTKYGEEGTFEYDNITKTVEYTLAPFVCYVEDEGSGTNIDYSNGSNKTIYKSKVSLGAFTKGYYTLTGRMGDGKTRTFYIYSKKGEVVSESLGSLSGKNGAMSTKTIFLADDVDELYLQNSDDNTIYDYVVVENSYVPVSITEAGWATLYTQVPLDFTSTGLEAYTASLEGSTVSLNPVTTVPANTGVVLKGSAGSYNIPVIASSETSQGDLRGSATEETAYDAISGKTLYILALNDAGDAQFFPTNAGSIAAGKAYLPITTSGAKSLKVVVNGEATGVEAPVVAENEEPEVLYNMAGIQVDKNYKGFVISSKGVRRFQK